VVRSFWRLTVTGDLGKHLAAILLEFIYGFSTACVVGVLLGYFMGMYKRFDEIMDPWIATLYSIPIIAIVPLIIIWFGISMVSKVIVVFKIAAVAIILNTAAGIKNLDPVWLELAKSVRLSNDI
jgi:NitT/TauT family transport system permease protein